MVSQSEITVGKANGRTSTQKTRSRKSSKSQKPAFKISAKQTHKALASKQGGTDIVPVMKLKAIDLVGADEKAKAKFSGKASADKDVSSDVLHMPPPDGPQNGTPGSGQADEQLVSDPELLELLQQLSETIDTANTVLEAAAPEPSPETLLAGGAAKAHGGEKVEAPVPAPKPEDPAPNDEELPLAAMSAAAQGSQPPLKPKAQFGFGLFLNAALSGLILTAGAAWLVHTNPWLLDRTGAAQNNEVKTAAVSEPSKDQSSLAKPEPQKTAVKKAATPPALASFTPPSPEPVPMEQAATAGTKLKLAQDTGPINAQAGQDVSLNVVLSPGQDSPETSVMVQGVPGDSKLSHGKNLGSGNWLLGEGQLENLKLETASTLQPGEHVIEFIVVKSDGSVPETRKVSVVVEGPSTSAKSTPSPQPGAVPVATASTTLVAKQTQARQVEAPLEPALPALSPTEVKALLARGTSLLEEGDVSGARLLLEYAAQRGSREAMIKLAQSYDPDHLLKLAVHGVRPDTKLSTLWYGRAEAAKQ